MVGPLYPWVLHPQILNMAQTQYFLSTVRKVTADGQLYTVDTTEWEGLEHLQMVVSVGVPEPIPHGAEGL